MSAGSLPIVADVEAVDDVTWLDRQAACRRYRLRPGANGHWIVRRRGGGVMLRTWTARVPPGPIDNDRALRRIWVDIAWRALNPPERDSLHKEIAKGERLHDR